MTAKNTTPHPGPAANTAPDSPATATPAPSSGAGNDGATAAIVAALAANPGATTATIATHAGVTAQAVRKALTALEAAGQARRSTGEHTGKGKPPTTWHPVTPTAAPAPASPDPADVGEHSDDAPAGTTPPATDAAARLAELAASAATAAMTALAAGDITTALAELDTARDHTTQARRTAKAALTHRTRTGPAMRPGQLRDRVQAHLAANPGASLTPHEISRVLGNSSGAIANALDKLIELGHAQLASDHPRRYITTG